VLPELLCLTLGHLTRQRITRTRNRMSDIEPLPASSSCLHDLRDVPTPELLRRYAEGHRSLALIRALLFRSLRGELSKEHSTMASDLRDSLASEFEVLSKALGITSSDERDTPRERLERLLKDLCGSGAARHAGEDVGDVVVVRGTDGRAVAPDASPASGSWNSFEQFAEHPTIAIRRPRPEVIVKKILTGEVEQKALQKRLREEMDSWALLAAADVAPTIYGVRTFTHKLPDKSEVELITAVPRKYSLSLDAFLKGKGWRADADVRGACSRVVDLCFRIADVGFCHLDIKFGNIVLDEHPLEVRLIDFDPQYMRDVARDAPLLPRLVSLLSLSSLAEACNVLRLFYVLLMVAFMAMTSERRQHRAQAQHAPQHGVAANFQKARSTFLNTLSELGGPFSIFFTDPELAKSGLMTLAADRMYNYDLLSAKDVADSHDASRYARKRLRAAAAALASGGGKYARATLRTEYEAAKQHRDSIRRDALLAHLLKALQDQTHSSLSPARPPTVRGVPFTETSSSPGQRRHFQSLEYSLVCHTPLLEGVRTLSAAAVRPAALKKSLSPEEHTKLREEALRRQRSARSTTIETAVRNKHGESGHSRGSALP